MGMTRKAATRQSVSTASDMITRFPLFVLLGVLLLATQPSYAQWSTAPADSASQDFRRRLLEALDLTAGQQDTLRFLRSRLLTDIEVLRAQIEDGIILAEEGRLRYGEAIEAYRTTRDSVLTVEQQQLLARARTYQREQALYDGLARPDEPQRLADALELDDLQRRRWLSLLARLRDQVAQLRSSGEMLTTEDYRRLREEYFLSFETLLLPDQRLELERVRLARAREQEELEAAQLELFDELAGEQVEDSWELLESELGEDDDDP